MKKINRNLVLFIAQDLQPLSVVENRGFRALVKTLDRRVKMPSRSSISSTHLPVMYEKVRAQLLKDLALVKWVALTTDLWTSKSQVLHDRNGPFH